MADPKSRKPGATQPAAPDKAVLVLEAPVEKSESETEAVEKVPDPVIDPKPEPQPALKPAMPRRGGSSFFGMVTGGVLAAIIGFALARYVVPEGWPFAGTSNTETRLVAQSEQLGVLQTEIAGLKDQLANVPAKNSIDALTDQVQQTKTDLAARIAGLEGRPNAIGGDASADVADLRTQMDALSAKVDKIGSTGGLTDEIQAAADAAQARIAEAEAQATALKADAEAIAKRAAQTAALGRVQAAVENGLPFAEPLSELASSGIEIPLVLSDAAETGLPSLLDLQASFPDAARTALDESLRSNAGDTFADRMTTFLRTQSGVRSLTPQEGTDPDAVLSRTEAALRKGDIQAALIELQALPTEGQAAMVDWVAQAQARLDASEAVSTLAAALAQQ